MLLKDKLFTDQLIDFLDNYCYDANVFRVILISMS